MCEWLSYGEWCDVKLLCGGRAFNAHKVVLASVSTFLRRLLLSCPPDESPTFIVLPDFDLDAMSSVLYYIYNGEVNIQKEKLHMFLDIIKAMQIFIDSQYLPSFSNNLEHKNFDIIKYESDETKRNVFTLGITDRDQRYINLKKGNVIQDILLQYSESDADCNDKLLRSQNLSGERKTSFGNLKSPYGDRQRNSFLRDLFIETYPRNGNVNGLTAGVLAISNECYRAPASVFLTNANGKHLSAHDIHLDPYKKINEHINHSSAVCNFSKQQCWSPNETDFGESSENVHNSSKLNVCCDTKSNKLEPQNIWMNHVPLTTNPLLQLRLQEQIMTGFCNLNIKPSIFDPVKSMQAYKLNEQTNYQCIKEDSTTPNKVAILNHVLESPWTPRIPRNYKPSRRKLEDSTQLQLPKQNINSIDNNCNDSNNNLPKPKKNYVTVEELTGNVKELTTCLPNISSDFKCTICNQVFTTSELLANHMRRHSVNARYTCGECGKTFSQLRNFKYHMSIHRGTREFAATCTVCGKYFNDRGYLSSHMKIHRNRKEYKCTLCPKSFNQRVAYNMHVRIHTGVKPHVCEECGKAFSRKMLLKQHQRTHSGERPYACPHCDKRFADRSNMTLHLRLHTGIKPFSCTLCPKSFTKKHHLKSHLNFHTGSKPYSCPRCKLAFTQSSNMRTHLKKCRAPVIGPDSDISPNAGNTTSIQM